MSVARSKMTETGGRHAATRHIPPRLALAVGMPSTPAPPGWRWSALTDLARLESGHTPSRKHPEYWGGTIPWIGIRDAKRNAGRRIDDTQEHVTELGIANSSARILPDNTVCLSRTASVGYVVVMGQPMATSQDFVNWVCGEHLDPDFLKYLLIAEGDGLLRFASGAVHQTIYFPEVKAFHVCHPSLAEQQRIVGILDHAFEGIASARANAERSLQNARNLYARHLRIVFARRGTSWTNERVDDACEVEYGTRATRKRDGGTTYRVYGGGGATFGMDAFNREDRVVVARFGMSERCTRFVGGRFFLNDSGLTLSPKKPESLLPEFLDLWTISQNDQIFALGKGTAQKNLDVPAFRCLPVSYPLDTEKQREFVTVLSAVEGETRHLESLYQRKLAALDELKQSLLHQAFTGAL